MRVWEAILLGVLQGITEWLPVSSEAIITLVHSVAFDNPVSDSLAYAFWLHLGTACSVLIMLRVEVIEVTKNILRQPLDPNKLVLFLLVATIASAMVGFPILLGIEELSKQVGIVAMGFVGIFMLGTGVVQLWWRGQVGARNQEELTLLDAVITGIAQGFAVLPGLSRSGLTISALLARRVDRREALVLSFLLSIPASVGAALYMASRDQIYMSASAFVAVFVAAGVGCATIRILMDFANRVNFGFFVVFIGFTMIVGTLLYALR